MSLRSLNPATGEIVAVHDEMTADEAAAALAACARAQRGWAVRRPEARAAALASLGRELRRETEALARLMAVEMGKPLPQGRAEVEKSASACDYYAERGPALLASRPVATEARRSLVAPRPLGVVLAIMPWNFPVWQAVRALAPALMAGNGVALKHAGSVTGCALELEKIARAAGLPEQLLAVLRLPGAKAGTLIDDPNVAAVTLTGSTPAGREVAARAGAALKKCVLELGGSDPFVVLADADLELAAAQAVASRMNNAGQSCIAAKRLIVEQPVASEFTRRLKERLAALTWGDPLEGEFDLGPLARADLRDEVHAQVARSVAAGARLELGGAIPAGPGAFYPPTLLTGVRPGMPAFDEELFGPVAAVVEAADEAEALARAADTPFGLGAAVFTRDLEKGERIARENFEAGSCFVNALVKSDPRLPFGGVKASGHGRELGEAGLFEFVNLKTVVVAG